MKITSSGKKFPFFGRPFGNILWTVILSANLCAGWLETVNGEQNHLPSFGTGAIKVRLYTDYFCPPCRDMESSLEPILLDLIKDGIIHLTFVDVPTSKHTVLYANYFLYALGEKKDFDSAILARRALFEAAEKKVLEKDQLVSLLTQKGIGLKPIDLKPVYNLWNRHLNEDQIRSTPSCVIVNGESKKIHKGALNIVKALEELKVTTNHALRGGKSAEK